MMRGALLGAIVLAVGTSAVAFAGDLLVRTRVTIAGSPRSTEEVQHWTGRKKVVDSETSRAIVDYEGRTVTTLDKRARTYRVTTLDELKHQVGQMTSLMNRGLRGLSREQRAGMGQSGFDPRPRFTLRPSGRRDRIAGLDAYELVLSGGPVTGSIWVSSDIRRPPEDREWAALTERFGGLDVRGSKLASAMSRLDGWPVRTDLYTPADVMVSSEVVEVGAFPVAPELLDVPDGYSTADDPHAPSRTSRR